MARALNVALNLGVVSAGSAAASLVAVHDTRSGAFSLQRQSGPTTSDPKSVEADQTRAGGKPPEADGVIRELDASIPAYDTARLAFDFSATYRLRFASDRMRACVQLNVRNVFENGRLQPIGVNPDGAAFAYRIIDPRQLTLSTTFDL